jgi:hypothetical protein
MKRALFSTNLQAMRSRKCVPSPQETLTDTHTHSLGHMITSSLHMYPRAAYSYTATVRLTAGCRQTELCSCPLLEPVPPASPNPSIAPRRYSIDGRIPSSITSSIELSCFSPVAQNDLLLLTSRSSPISHKEIASHPCNDTCTHIHTHAAINAHKHNSRLSSK